MTWDRDAVVEQATSIIHRHMQAVRERGDYLLAPAANEAVDDVLLNIVHSITDEVREMHHPIDVAPGGRTESQLQICRDCSWQLPNGRFFGRLVKWPCPDIALCDEIDAAAGVTR